MPYDKAKRNFEAVVKSMQTDLQKWVDSGQASQRGVDIRTDHINKLIEFYQQAESLVQTSKQAELQRESDYLKLHEHTERLVYWSTLHRANPNQIFKYELAELKLMIRQGRRFGRAEDLYFDKENVQFNNQTEKYLTTRLICSRK